MSRNIGLSEYHLIDENARNRCVSPPTFDKGPSFAFLPEQFRKKKRSKYFYCLNILCNIQIIVRVASIATHRNSQREASAFNMNPRAVNVDAILSSFLFSCMSCDVSACYLFVFIWYDHVCFVDKRLERNNTYGKWLTCFLAPWKWRLVANVQKISGKVLGLRCRNVVSW